MVNLSTTKFHRHSIIPGFYLCFSFTVIYLFIIVLLPILALFFKAINASFADIAHNITDKRILSAFYVSFFYSFVAAIIDVIFGFIIAWVLVRYNFPFKKVFDAIIDLPFALPTAVAGIALSAIYAPDGVIGKFFIDTKIAFSPLGITIALVFIGLPFIVRSIQPVLEDLDSQYEEAAVILGANRWQTFIKVIFPYLLPSVLTGFTMAFARCVGEYGSVIFIAGNIPFVSEIVPLVIITKLEQFDYNGATVVGLLMLLVSFSLLLFMNTLQKKLFEKTK